MNKKIKKTLITFFISILIWQIIAYLKLLNPIYFASPIEIFNEILIMIKDKTIFFDIIATTNRILYSALISSIIGIPLGILLGYFREIYEYIEELIDFLRSIPPIVIYPLLLIVLGPSDLSRIGVAMFGSTVVLVLVISKGLNQVSELKRKYFKSLGASEIDILKHIILYEALPYVMVGLRTAISITIIVIIVTEMLVGSKYGLGSRVENVQITNNIPDLFTTILIIGLIGILFNKILIEIDKKIIFWK